VTRYIRLVLTGRGPVYLRADEVTESGDFRRVRNLYYSRDFAEVLYREALLCNAKAPLLCIASHRVTCGGH
jgi:hypothetical protein